MIIVGVICEYNPFHNGHRHHLDMIRRELGECVIICCMSGSFTQRGEIACLPPTERTRAALLHGADVVFELPVLHTVRSAEYYARGGVGLLDSLGICDYLSFGCEDVRLLEECYGRGTEMNLKRSLAEGSSYAKAYGLPNLPNLILGVEYLRALDNLNSGMKPLPIARIQSDRVKSASELRNMLRSGDKVSEFVPTEIDTSMLRFTETLDTLLLGMLRGSSPEEVRETLDVSEGLENLIYRHAFRASSRGELIHLVKSKRYTYTRISRILTQFTLGITKRSVENIIVSQYARLLGFCESAGPILKHLQKNSIVRIITKPSVMKNSPLFRLDAKAASIAALASSDKAHSIFEESPIIQGRSNASALNPP
ncbi:MAG: nucleotidyltransferase family protein [Oscillospiraceae bacterium]|nr:nucleotidyltransferase family protein [Oscillospiraceae bacterium]